MKSPAGSAPHNIVLDASGDSDSNSSIAANDLDLELARC
jgi:hypothetical protein